MKAMLDLEGHPVSGRFNVVRPHDTKLMWLKFLWAFCNSPIANAFVYCHAGKRHIDAGLVRTMPFPVIDSSGVDAVVDAAEAYIRYVAPSEDSILSRPIDPQRARNLLAQVDNEILKLYGLPRELEWKLLKLFSGSKRGGVPFTFDEYLPSDLAEPVSLNEYLAITIHWSTLNQRRGSLIKKKVAKSISSAEQGELADLQRLAELGRRVHGPLPISELEERFRLLTGEALE